MTGRPVPYGPPQEHALRRFAAAALQAIGWLIVVLSGLCTGVLAIATLPDMFKGTFDYGYLMLPLMFAGIPIVFGGVLILIGRALRVKAASTEQP